MWRMKREDFAKLVAEALDSLPKEFRRRIRNVAVLVEDLPPDQEPSEPGQPKRLLLGLFQGVPLTHKSVFHTFAGPDRIVLYQRNIEPFARARPKCANKFGRQSSTNLDITLG